MIITPASIAAMFSGFHAAFREGYAAPATVYERIAMMAPSTGETETYSWMADIPRFREWVGERVYNNLVAHGYTLANKDWEDSFAVPRNKIMDDSYAIFAQRFQALGEAARLWPDDMLLTALEAGDGALCYDGQYFFDTDHPVDLYDASKGTQANLLTSTALTQNNYFTAKAAFRKFKSESGQRMGLTPDLMIVPPALEQTAKAILKADTIAQVYGSNTAAAAPTNVSKGDVDLLVWDRLGDDTTWYLLCTKRSVKPFVFQQRKAPEFVDKGADVHDEDMFKRKQYVYGSDARGNMGYALWFLAMQCNA